MKKGAHLQNYQHTSLGTNLMQWHSIQTATCLKLAFLNITWNLILENIREVNNSVHLQYNILSLYFHPGHNMTYEEIYREYARR